MNRQIDSLPLAPLPPHSRLEVWRRLKPPFGGGLAAPVAVLWPLFRPEQIHAATHPAAILDKNNAPSLPKQAQAGDAIAAQLFAVLDAEAEEEKE